MTIYCKTRLKTILFMLSVAFILFSAVPVYAVEEAQTIVPEGEKIGLFECEEGFGISKALAMLGSMCQKNIVHSSQVDGQLGFRSLRDVTFEEAMDAILGEAFVYEEEGNLIKVYTKAEYKDIKENPDRMEYRIFTLYYISAAEAMNLIGPALTEAGSVEASSPTEAVGTTGDSITTGTGGGDTMALNDTIVVLDYPENIAKAEELLKELDVRPQQVLVEATILSATLNEGMQFGIEWNSLDGVSVDTIGNIGLGDADGLETTGFTTGISGGLGVGISNAHVEILIRALETVTDTTVLANPKILAVNKQLGQVYIGTKIGYLDTTTTTQTSSTQSVAFLDTGTKLAFRPYIGNDGYIRMDIHPKDSSGALKTNQIPDESSTELATNIMVKDGQTIVIGGLFRDVVTTSRNQIPILGDLPLVGPIFRGTTDSTTRQEVIVMLTPHIIDEPEETDGQDRAEDISRKRAGANKELQSIGRAKIAEESYTNAAASYLAGDNELAMEQLEVALKLRPSYLEAIRLKERILSETSPEEVENLDRNVIESIDDLEAPKWQRN